MFNVFVSRVNAQLDNDEILGIAKNNHFNNLQNLFDLLDDCCISVDQIPTKCQELTGHEVALLEFDDVKSMMDGFAEDRRTIVSFAGGRQCIYVLAVRCDVDPGVVKCDKKTLLRKKVINCASMLPTECARKKTSVARLMKRLQLFKRSLIGFWTLAVKKLKMH